MEKYLSESWSGGHAPEAFRQLENDLLPVFAWADRDHIVEGEISEERNQDLSDFLIGSSFEKPLGRWRWEKGVDVWGEKERKDSRELGGIAGVLESGRQAGCRKEGWPNNLPGKKKDEEEDTKVLTVELEVHATITDRDPDLQKPEDYYSHDGGLRRYKREELIWHQPVLLGPRPNNDKSIF